MFDVNSVYRKLCYWYFRLLEFSEPMCVCSVKKKAFKKGVKRQR